MANIEFVWQQQCAISIGQAVIIVPLPTCLLHSKNWRNLLRKVYLWTWRFKLVRRCMQKLLEHRMWMKKFRWVKKIKKIKNLGFLPQFHRSFSHVHFLLLLEYVCCVSSQWSEWSGTTAAQRRQQSEHSTAQHSTAEPWVWCFMLCPLIL